DQGLPDAQNNLGFSYAHGLGVKQNWGEAIQWYSRAADQGHALAQANLGSCYGAGEGVPQDWAESTKWYQRSAAQGFALGQSNLGVAYANGQGIQQDFVQAYMWYSLALSSIPSVDRDGRELALTNRNRLAELMTSEEIEEAEKAAYQWKSTEL
ncbi:MAG: sel1 repeat family protein, partial [Gammaproteobacteria bacterium]|nr:sel1 repeat family protein [Gammaproteobacteria bacterium]